MNYDVSQLLHVWYDRQAYYDSIDITEGAIQNSVREGGDKSYHCKMSIYTFHFHNESEME